MQTAFEAFAGVKIVSLVFACIGAALGITYTKEMTKRTALAAMLAGICSGGLGPEFISWSLAIPLPAVVNNVLALVCGIGGMFIVPGILKIWQGFSDDPWQFFDRFRSAFGKSKSGNDGNSGDKTGGQS